MSWFLRSFVQVQLFSATGSVVASESSGSVGVSRQSSLRQGFGAIFQVVSAASQILAATAEVRPPQDRQRIPRCVSFGPSGFPAQQEHLGHLELSVPVGMASADDRGSASFPGCEMIQSQPPPQRPASANNDSSATRLLHALMTSPAQKSSSRPTNASNSPAPHCPPRPSPTMLPAGPGIMNAIMAALGSTAGLPEAPRQRRATPPVSGGVDGQQAGSDGRKRPPLMFLGERTSEDAQP